MSTNKLTNYRLLEKEAKRQGAQAFGVADISNEKKKFDLPARVLANFDSAISLGVPLSFSVLSTIDESPTKIYFHHYRVANAFLDQLAFKMANFIQTRGFMALPIPASQIVDWQKQTAHLSHKRIGQLSGLGWLGRNNLLVNEKFGARFRLVTILTDMPLRADKALKRDCGSCRACIMACPVSAIKGKKEDFDHQKCFEKLKEFQKSGVVGQYVCGICVKACKGII